MPGAWLQIGNSGNDSGTVREPRGDALSGMRTSGTSREPEGCLLSSRRGCAAGETLRTTAARRHSHKERPVGAISGIGSAGISVQECSRRREIRTELLVRAKRSREEREQLGCCLQPIHSFFSQLWYVGEFEVFRFSRGQTDR